MTQFYAPVFGRLTPSPEKMAQNGLYSIGSLPEFVVPTTVEAVLPYPAYTEWYNQGRRNACTGFSTSWASSIMNIADEAPPPKYDAVWLYHQGQIIDGDPQTDPSRDVGGYIWACMDVLKKKGHRKVVGSVTYAPDLIHGIQSYYWARTVDELRSAIFQNRPVVIGIGWYDEFNRPVKYNGEMWIGRSVNWNNPPLGGHAIVVVGASDLRQGVLLLNTWGPTFPPSWIPYSTIEKLMARSGEMCVPLDYVPTPPVPTSPSPSFSISPSASASMSWSPSPSPSHADGANVEVTIDGKRYSGFIERKA